MTAVRFNQVEREKICDLAQRTLWEDETDDVKETLLYLREQRGLSDEVIKQYRFGYIPRRARHTWSERIIMPLYNEYGQLVVLTSRKYRAVGDQYSHLHETFDKRYHIYGLNVALQDIMKLNRAVVVEGQFDTAMLRSRGIKTVVAVLGSAFTMEHACILRRYCSEIYLVFDNDKAGRHTLKRSMLMAQEEGLEEGFGMTFVPVLLPSQNDKKVDPDDFVKQNGVAEFVTVLQDAKLLRKQFSIENLGNEEE